MRLNLTEIGLKLLCEPPRSEQGDKEVLTGHSPQSQVSREGTGSQSFPRETGPRHPMTLWRFKVSLRAWNWSLRNEGGHSCGCLSSLNLTDIFRAALHSCPATPPQ